MRDVMVCEYCDNETECTHFPFLGINACDNCVRIHDVQSYENARWNGSK